MPCYETILVIRQEMPPAQVEILTDQFQGHITAGGGVITRRENWGLRTLAYRIRKNRKGHYVLLNYEAPPPAVWEMERNIRLSEDVLRYLTIRTEEAPKGLSVMMTRRDERGPGRDDRDRGDRGDRDRKRDGRRRDGDRRPEQGRSMPLDSEGEDS